jgi:hypothetical protein
MLNRDRFPNGVGGYEALAEAVTQGTAIQVDQVRTSLPANIETSDGVEPFMQWKDAMGIIVEFLERPAV